MPSQLNYTTRHFFTTKNSKKIDFLKIQEPLTLCYFSRRKRPNDFGTGDYVRVKVTRGRNAGIRTGRTTLSDGYLSVETKAGRVKATFQNSKVLFKNDGYKYQYLSLERT